MDSKNYITFIFRIKYETNPGEEIPYYIYYSTILFFQKLEVFVIRSSNFLYY